MGVWAKNVFGRESFGKVGIVLAGHDTPEFEKRILYLFEGVVSSKDVVYHAHLLKKGGIAYPIVLNVYGAPALVDALAEMHDGGCRNVLFIGYAYGGFNNTEIGAIVIPDKSYHFDGIYHPIEPDRMVSKPDKELQEKLKSVFKRSRIKYFTGTNISVPAVTLQPKHANEAYRRIKPATLEMELAACYSRARDIGMRTAGVLIISDNRDTSIGDKAKNELKHSTKARVIKTVADNISKFNLKPLKSAEDFKIDTYLASIIEDAEDKTNVYKQGGK